VHLKKLQLGPDVAADPLAALTPGFTGADLANLANEAALVATRRGASQVAMADFTAAIERIVAGLEKKNRLLNPRERKVVAHHEMGHVLVAAALPGTDPVHKVSILPRGIGALGYTIQRPTEDRYLMSRAELENKMAVLLGGRAAEQIVFDQLSTGAADDLAKATEIAMTMVTRYAMVPELGNMTYELEQAGPLGPRRTYSEQTAREIDCAARAIVERSFKHARRVLERNREVLQGGAAMLYEKESLSEGDLSAWFDRLEKEPPLVFVA
jgi:cell division protease FtsH